MKNNACCDSADRSCRIIYIHNKLVAGVGKGGGVDDVWWQFADVNTAEARFMNHSWG